MPLSHRPICWAHLTRDFERFAHSSHSAVKTLGYALRNIAAKLFTLAKACLAQKADAPHVVRVARNIIKVERAVWKFLDDPLPIPLTNNLAERQIRHYGVYRKNSYFSQSERGNRFLESIISLYLTWKQQNLHPFQKLLQTIS